MIRFLILLFVFSVANADSHGYRLTVLSPESETLFEIIFRSKPTAEENYNTCVLDGEALLVFQASRGRTPGTYKCERE